MAASQVKSAPITILPDPAQLHLLGLAVETTETTHITASVVASASDVPCPVCGQRSARIHSRYMRHVSDLPWHGVPLRLELHVRRFFCDNAACPRQIFTERLPGIVTPYAHRTERLQEWFAAVAFTAGGEAGARLLRLLGLATSPDTLLRQLRGEQVVPVVTPKILSVDDFALRRGNRYGTLLVDLERQQPVDVLPDRTAETFAAWLQTHPGVAVISRDRGGAYAEGARQGAPQAIQVADRFHLLRNLVDALQALLGRESAALSAAAVTASALQAPATEPEQPSRAAWRASGAPEGHGLPTDTPAPPGADGAPDAPHPLAHLAHRRVRYDRVIGLHAEGCTLSEIARRVGLHRDTVRRYVQMGQFPVSAKRRRVSALLTPFDAYLRERWAAGEQNGRVLLAELRERGYRGGASALYAYLAHWRSGPPRRGRRPHSAPPVPPPPRTYSPRRTCWLLLKTPADRTPEEAAYCTALLTQRDTIARVTDLVQRFFQMVRERHADQLEAWLSDAETSASAELIGFAQGIRRDRQAVDAGLTLEWSQGQTEGQVNRLKMAKRQMYGRAKLDLLRQRVLHRDAS